MRLRPDTTTEQRPSTVDAKGVRRRHKRRPVHPECAAYTHGSFNCTCSARWGDTTDLDESNRIYHRLDRRTKWGQHLGTRGRGPDLDEPAYTGADELELLDAYEVSAPNEIERDGFWKESEFLAQFLDTTE